MTEQHPSSLASIDQAISALQAGRMVILWDSESREDEGDLVLAAEKVTPQAINFMSKFGRGLICLPMLGEALDRLSIPLMVEDKPVAVWLCFYCKH